MLVALLAVVLAPARGALALCIDGLDQSQTTLGGSDYVGGGYPSLPQSLAQTFVPGSTGCLTRVDLHLVEYYGNASAPLIVKIVTTPGGLPRRRWSARP